MTKYSSRRRRNPGNSRRIGRGADRTASASGRTVLHPSAALPRARSRTRSPVPAVFDSSADLMTDLRAFHPEPAATRPYTRTNGRPARVVATPVKKRDGGPKAQRAALLHPSTLLFASPQSVSVCVRRGVRKEVLHAKNVAGKVGLRKPKMKPSSQISCKG